jgi:hypothetical protein
MAILINEQRMIEDNAVMYEKRSKSPIRRFTDRTFTPTRYWHIKTNDTTVDGGWGDVADTIGPNSPIKFLMIENLPLCGIEAILPQIEEGDFGLDTRFESEATTMNGMIKPYPNDYFMITYLKEPMIFRVTAVDYDNLASDNTYKIQYSLEYNDAEKVEELMRQTVNEYSCLLENVGTDERCIIEKADMDVISDINKMYDQIVESYISLYYNERYNCFLGDFVNGMKLYDPFQEMFINKHRLFTRKNQIDGLVLIEQFKDPQREIKYQKSVYRFIELKRKDKLSTFRYTVSDGKSNPQTAFYRWMDPSIAILDIPKIMNPTGLKYTIFSEDFVEAIKLNAPIRSEHAGLIQRYVRGEELHPSDISLKLHDVILGLDDANLEVFFITPIILYIIKDVIKERLSKVRRTDNVESFI